MLKYNDSTWSRFDTARRAGVLGGPPETRVGGGERRRGAAGSAITGTWVQFDVLLAPAAGATSIVEDVRFVAFACPHVIAVADWLAETALGREAPPGLPVTIQSLQARFEVPVEKLGRLLIVEDAWIAAISSPYKAEVR